MSGPFETTGTGRLLRRTEAEARRKPALCGDKARNPAMQRLSLPGG